MGEIWKAILGLLVTGAPLLAVQLGGRRGLVQRAIREELELIHLLDDPDHAEVRDRLHQRVQTRLEQYEPGEGAKRRRQLGRVLAVTEFAVLMVVAIVVLEGFGIESTRASLLVGGGLGALGAVAHILLASRLDKREQDQAVIVSRVAAATPRKQAHFEADVEALPEDRGK